jgi:hypothetical protein
MAFATDPLTAPGPSGPAAARNVLVVGTDDWATEQVTAQLSDAGHPVLSCHPQGEPGFPCNAMVEGRTCPLDVGFDVVLSVRARPLEQPAIGEMGAVCGLRAGATLVLAGMTRGNPFGPWASAVVENGDLVATVEQALAARAGTDTPAA